MWRCFLYENNIQIGGLPVKQITPHDVVIPWTEELGGLQSQELDTT